MRRFHYFLFVLFAYLSYRLLPGLGFWTFPILGVVFAGVLLYPTHWLRKSSMQKWQHIFRWFVYMDMGFLTFLACLVFFRDLLYFPVLAIKPEWTENFFGFESSLIILVLSFVALKLGMWNALSGPKIKTVKVPIANLPQSLQGYRIAQISDLHVGPTIGSRYVRKVVQRTNALAPHMTVLTGDIVDGDAEHHLEAVKILKDLEPAGQVMYVTGNHEYYWDGPRWIQEFQDLGLNVLLNSSKRIQHHEHEIHVAGVLDPAVKLFDPKLQPNLVEAGQNMENAAVKILLAHQPDIAYEASEAGYDLLLSGHTHAGQFFPFTWLIFSVQKFVKGLKACGKMWVYVNQGTGYWGPPIRLGTVTEITLLELTAK